MPDKTQSFDIPLKASPEIVTTVTLAKGPCTLTAIAPFGTAITVLPVPGLTFRDLDSNANVYVAEFNVPRTGQYSFTTMLSQPVDGNQLHISFSNGTSSNTQSENNPPPNNDLPDFPPQPTQGWRFIYYMRFAGGFTRCDVLNWGTSNTRLYHYHTNTENAVWETLINIRHEGYNNYKSTVMQDPNITQGFSFSQDWKVLRFGTAMKFVLEKKIRA
jgi:hypothetical protein